MIELIDLKHLSQDQLINIANKVAVYLDRENYDKTHLFINGQNSEPEVWWNEAK